MYKLSLQRVTAEQQQRRLYNGAGNCQENYSMVAMLELCRTVRAFDPVFAATNVDVAFVDGMVAAMVAAYGGSNVLAPSYDPMERKQGMTVIESEWRLLRLCIAG